MKRTFCFALALVCWLGFSAVSFAAPTSAEPTVQGAAPAAPAAKGHRRHRRHHRRHHRHHRHHGGHKTPPKKG